MALPYGFSHNIDFNHQSIKQKTTAGFRLSCLFVRDLESNINESNEYSSSTTPKNVDESNKDTIST